MIVEHHDVEFVAFLQCRDDLLRHHQVRAIAHEHVHLALGMCHLHTQSSRDFIAHARVAILHVVAAGLTSAPEFMKVSRHTSCGTHHDVGGFGEID